VQEQHHGFRRSALRALTLFTLAALNMPVQAATRNYTISSFDAIRIDAPVNVVLTTGTGVSARADGDQGALDRLRVELSGRVLSVTMERPQPGQKSSGNAALLRLSTGMLEKLVMTGGGSVSVDRMKGLRGEIICGGNGDVSVGMVDLDRIDLSFAGGGRASLTGRAGVANIRLSGPGAVAAEALHARQANIVNEGAGSLTVTADVTAKIVASGSGDVVVTGKAACTVDNRGTGRIGCGGDNW
jgi:hypothetical protein